MSNTLEAVVGAIGIIIFVIVFIAGLELVQDAGDQESPKA